MINFDGVPTHEYDELTSTKRKLDINEVLNNIDAGNTSYLEELPEEERKQFTPYVVLRFLGSLDDSVQLTYRAKDLEDVLGKWAKGAKEILNEFIEEFNGNPSVNCTGVKKYEHAKYDWRIGFSVQDKKTADELTIKLSEFGVSPIETISLISATDMKNYIIMLNELVNMDFWDMQKFPNELYKMMCCISTMIDTKNLKRSWIPFSKSIKNTSDPDILAVFKQTLDEPTQCQLNSSEYQILLRSYDKKSFKELLNDLGKSEDEAKKLLTKFDKEQKKHG